MLRDENVIDGESAPGLDGDRFDLNAGQLAAAADGAVVALALLVFERDDLLAAMLIDNFTGNLGSFENWVADANVCVLGIKENLVKCGGVASLSLDFFEIQFVSHGHFILFAASFDDCVCHSRKVIRRVCQR